MRPAIPALPDPVARAAVATVAAAAGYAVSKSATRSPMIMQIIIGQPADED